MSSSPLRGKARHRATIRMVARFGLQIWWLNKTKRFRSKELQMLKKSQLYTRQAQEFRNTAMQMGGLIIKLGQHLSTHIELLPKEYISELSQLQDCVAPVETVEIIETIETELGKALVSLYPFFDTQPVAAASLGQVHKARLASGHTVAVKVLRPGIEEIIATDLESLRTSLTMLDRFTSMGKYLDIENFYQEFETTITHELNLNEERISANKFKENFSTNTQVYVPKTFEEYTTKRVLTLEFVEGIKINELAQLDGRKVNRNLVAHALLEAYVQMILKDGLFHADPHPGNVLVRPDGGIILLDFGMIGTISSDMRSAMVKLAMGIFLRDAHQSVEALQELGFLRTSIDTQAFEKSFTLFLDRMFAKSNTQEMNISEDLAEELGEFMRSQPFQLPDNVTFLIKAITTVVGLCVSLDPKIDLVGELSPSVQEAIGTVEEGVFGGFREDMFSTIIDQVKELLPELFGTIKRSFSVVSKADRGELAVKISKVQEQRIMENNVHQSQKIVKVIVGATCFLSGVILLGAAYQNLAYREIFAYVLAGFGFLLMLSQMRLGKKSKRRRAPHPTFRQ